MCWILLIKIIPDPTFTVKRLGLPSNANYRAKTERERNSASFSSRDSEGAWSSGRQGATCGYVCISLTPWHSQEPLCKALIWKHLKKTYWNVLLHHPLTHNQYTFKRTHLYLALTLHFTMIQEIFAVLHLELFSNLTSLHNKYIIIKRQKLRI